MFHLESDLCMMKLTGHRVSSLHMSQRSQIGKFTAQPEVSKFCFCTCTAVEQRDPGWLNVLSPLGITSDTARGLCVFFSCASHLTNADSLALAWLCRPLGLSDSGCPWFAWEHCVSWQDLVQRQQDENQHQQQSLKSIKWNFYSIHRNSTCILSCFIRTWTQIWVIYNNISDKLPYII